MIKTKKLLIDCTFISTTGLNTGIQRVVRKVVENIKDITKNSPYEPIEVSLEDGKIKKISLTDITENTNEELVTKKDDVLLLLDSTWHLNIWDSVYKAKENGTMVVAVTYDIIPISHPEFCDQNLVKIFSQWFDTAIDYVDGFIAISDTVRESLQEYLNKKYPEKAKKKFFDFFLLGADFKYQNFDLQSSEIRKELVELYQENSSIYLIVCTVEPRKNHKYLLDVFDKLWEENRDVSLNIVGKEGWMVDELINRIKTHPNFGKKLFHFSDLGDEELNYAYQKSKMLLFPSFIEGFGLPIVESLNNKLPVLASDIPIHREVGQDKIGYFDLNNIEDLKNKIETIENEGIPANLIVDKDYSYLNWNQSTNILFERVEENHKKFKFDSKAFKNLKSQKEIQVKEKIGLKATIKKLPVIGFLFRWSYNILRINNLKHNHYLNSLNIQTLNNTVAHLTMESNKLKLQQEQFSLFNVRQTEQMNKVDEQLKHNKIKHNEHDTRLNNQETQIASLIQQNQQLKETILKQDNQIQDLKRESKLNSENNYNINQFIKNEVQKLFSKELQSIHHRLSAPPTTHQTPPTTTSALLDDYYLSFENTFRGSEETIKERYKSYLKYLNLEVKNAIDIGCGRGEWVELLQENSIDAMGIDLNQAMLSSGVTRGVKNLQKFEAIEYLQNCQEKSYDLISSFHLIEHIPFEQLILFLQGVKKVAKENATILLETPNPRNPHVATFSFYTDPTHLNPLPAEAIKFLLEYLGFKDVQIDYLNQPEGIPLTPESAQDYLLIAKA